MEELNVEGGGRAAAGGGEEMRKIEVKRRRKGSADLIAQSLHVDTGQCGIRVKDRLAFRRKGGDDGMRNWTSGEGVVVAYE